LFSVAYTVFHANRNGNFSAIVRSSLKISHKMEKLSERLLQTPSPVVDATPEIMADLGLRLLVKRDDLIHPAISGNKWRKLKYNLLEARRQGYERLLTFGGAYSNHLVAVAAAGREFGFSTMGIVRGEKCEPLNPVLRFVEACGMEVFYVSRTKFRQKNRKSMLADLKINLDGVYVLPEGGTNCLALAGCREIIAELDTLPNYVCVSCGTGGTMAGIVAALQGTSMALGFSVLKGNFMKNSIRELLTSCGETSHLNWDVIEGYHFGGYAKVKPELLSFMHRFTAETGIPSDPIYTGKMFFAILDLAQNGFFKKGSTILAVHTGGLPSLTMNDELTSNVYALSRKTPPN
jgi:1-aminocyclopropane-1-carboxylate deaminase/D-cysteine desulfhydrase-like pyridoxal-dependent ACC family enzyme